MNIRRIHKFLAVGFFVFCFLLSANSMRAEEEVLQDPVANQVADSQQVDEVIKVTLDFKETDINSVLSGISKSYNLNIIAGRDIQGKVTVNFNDVSLEEALTAILDINGYKFIRKGTIIYIVKKEDDVASDYFMLKYTNASSAKELLSSMLSEKGSIKIDSINNSLVITDTIERLLAIKEFVNEIDIVPTQVMIEAKIVDVTLKDLENMGITWGGTYKADKLFSSRDEDYDGGSGNDQSITSTLSMAGPSSTLSGSQLTLATLLAGGRSIDVTLDALIQDQRARILATPSVVTLNNQEARIIIGEKVPYKEKTQTTTGTTETTKYIDVGTTLRVTPQVNNDKTITMVIHPEVSSVSSLLDAGPRITTREADVTVMVNDRETIVIGGLLKEEDTIVRNKVPIVGDIPLLGLLFSSKSVNKEQKELVVFITPKIITSSTETIKEDESEQKVLVDDLAQRLFVDKIINRADNLLANKDLESSEKTKLTRLNEAVFLYDQVGNVYPESPRAVEALFKGARIEKMLGNDERYETKLNMIVNNYPDSRYTPYALSQIKAIEKRRSIKSDRQDELDKAEFKRMQIEKERRLKEDELKRLKQQRIQEAEQFKKQQELEREKLVEQQRLEKEQRIKESEELQKKREEEQENLKNQRIKEVEELKQQQEQEILRKQEEAQKLRDQRIKEAEELKEQRIKEAEELKEQRIKEAEELKQQRELERQQRIQEAEQLKKQREQEALRKQEEAQKLRDQRIKEAEERRIQLEQEKIRNQKEAQRLREERIKKAKEIRLKKIREAELKKEQRLKEIERIREEKRRQQELERKKKLEEALKDVEQTLQTVE